MVEKAINTKIKASLQPPSGTRKIDSRCPNAIDSLQKTSLVGTIKMTRLSPAPSLLLLMQINFRLRSRPSPPTKTNISKEAVEEVIQLSQSTLPKWQKSIRIRPRT